MEFIYPFVKMMRDQYNIFHKALILAELLKKVFKSLFVCVKPFNNFVS
jgi:hypothetical protein